MFFLVCIECAKEKQDQPTAETLYELYGKDILMEKFSSIFKSPSRVK